MVIALGLVLAGVVTLGVAAIASSADHVTVDTTAIFVSGDEQTRPIHVTASSSRATWSAATSTAWLTLSPAAGSGNGTVMLTAAPNPTALPRTAIVTIAGRQVTVTQDGAVPSSASTPWTVADAPAWLTVSPGSGTGSGAVTLTAAPNMSVQPRTATVTIAGRPVTVTQDGAIPAFAVTPGTWSADANGGLQNVGLTSSIDDAPWTASSDRTWMMVSPGAGAGSGTLALTIAANASVLPRTATATIAGRLVIVTQAGAVPDFGVTPRTWNAAAGGGTQGIAVASSPGDASWTASSDRAWLSLSPAAGTGPGGVTLTVAPTTSAQPRTATAMIAGQAVIVTQAGAVPNFAITQGTWGVAAGGGTRSLAVASSLGDAPWTASSNQAWLSLSPAAGTGPGAVTLTAAPTASAQPRTATATIAGQAVIVTQAGAVATFAVTPGSSNVSADGGTHGVTVTSSLADAPWTAASDVPWLSVSPTSATGSGMVTVMAAAAAGQLGRTGTLTIAGRTVAVSQTGHQPVPQPGPQPTATISEPSWVAPTNGGSREITLEVPDATSWEVSTDAPWITISPARGSGHGSVTIAAMPAGSVLSGFSITGQEAAAALDIPDGASTMTVSQFHAGAVRTGTVVFAPVAPAASYTRYLAEGATSSMFDTRLALFNPGTTADVATVSFLRDGQAPLDYRIALPPQQRVTLWPKSIAGLESAEFSTTVTAAVPVVVDRTMTWDASGYGAHAETAAVAPSPTWYLAEGATHSGFALFYLLQNPGDTATTVRVRYLRATGAPLEKDYRLAARSRSNIWVNVEEFPGLGQALASAEFSAVISSLDQTPIIVERAMYRSSPDRPFDAGHVSMGVSTPSTRWFMAEGRTGPFFDQFVLIANPTDTPADVRVTYLLDTGQTYTKTMMAPASARSGIWVDYDEIPGVAGHPLADVALSTTVESLNGVPLVVERTMWWPGDGTTWYEAHNSSGATETGTKWAMAEGEVGGSRNAQTYVLIANTSTWQGRARVTVLFEDGTSRTSIYPLRPQSRTSAAIGPDFGAAVEGKRFSVIVESLGATDGAPVPQVVVERAMYSDAGGVPMAAGTNALATKLQ
ncbi:BACON domain-containing protein [Luteitalea pratensis]|uniref:BACON domain-containing protein n=1 Tax=Luteitalea pratensis TaxID=1855912 RepID=UPI0013902D56|nr:BACON domain-containing protein [Luteitalea pratensis]